MSQGSKDDGKEGGGSMTCAEVVERLVAGTDRGGADQDPAVAEHARSCMSCFRAMTELRDVPRLAEALRAAAPAPDPGERFWEVLAERSPDAVSATMAAGVPAQPARTAPPDRRRRFMGLRSRIVSIGAMAVAAAAGLVLVARHSAMPPAAPGAAATAVVAGQAGEIARSSAEDANNEALGEVADLDSTALRRLLDRLGRHAPAPLAAGSADDGADVPIDDEPRVSDEVAELDGDALRRVASSLEASAL